MFKNVLWKGTQFRISEARPALWSPSSLASVEVVYLPKCRPYDDPRGYPQYEVDSRVRDAYPTMPFKFVEAQCLGIPEGDGLLHEYWYYSCKPMVKMSGAAGGVLLMESTPGVTLHNQECLATYKAGLLECFVLADGSVWTKTTRVLPPGSYIPASPDTCLT